MSTNARHPTCDIKTNHLTPNEAADTSSEVEILSDMPVTKSVVEKKQDIPDKGSEANSELFLDKFSLDLIGKIIVILGRMWDVSAVTGRYLSTDFVVLDAKDFDDIESSDNKYLIGELLLEKYFSTCCQLCDQCRRTNHLKSDSKNLDFHLANHRGKYIRVTLWGSLRDVLIEKKNQTDWCVPNKVYLSSTSSTVIYDDDTIPAIKALKKKIDKVYLSSTSSTVIYDDDTIPAIKALKKKIVDYLVLRYRLEVDVSNNTAQAVSSEDHLSLSPTLSNLIGTAHVMEIKIHLLSLCPNMWRKEKKARMDVEDSESEDRSDSANVIGKKGDVEPSAKKRKNRCHDFRTVYDETDSA
ncbi:hypothetical protein Tco_1054176 [Tanacetum coccineum]|uniref:Replication protein A OB domain-containing protein n=1 Tax=Tanacetum coccineum TaxID=301880 RepID=A0ABQ5GWX9_9ASTR